MQPTPRSNDAPGLRPMHRRQRHHSQMLRMARHTPITGMHAMQSEEDELLLRISAEMTNNSPHILPPTLRHCRAASTSIVAAETCGHRRDDYTDGDALAVDLCNAAAAAHDLGRYDRAADLYDESLDASIDALRTSAERHELLRRRDRFGRGKRHIKTDLAAAASSETTMDGAIATKECILGLDAAEVRLRRRAKLNAARCELIREKRGNGNGIGNGSNNSNGNSGRSRALGGNSNSGDPPAKQHLLTPPSIEKYLDLYTSRARGNVSSLVRPRTAGRAFPRYVRAATLLHNMGLLHLHRAVAEGEKRSHRQCPHRNQRQHQLKTSRRGRLLRAEQLLHMARTTILDGQRREGRPEPSTAVDRRASKLLLFSTFVAVGQTMTELGRLEEASSALGSAMELARRALEDINEEENDDAEHNDCLSDCTVVVSVKRSANHGHHAQDADAITCGPIGSAATSSETSGASSQSARPFTSDLRSLTILALNELGRARYLSGRYVEAVRDAEDALALIRAAESGDDLGEGRAGSGGSMHCLRRRRVTAAIYNVGLAREGAGDSDGAREAYARFANELLGSSGGDGSNHEDDEDDDARHAHVVTALVRIIILDCEAAKESGNNEEGALGRGCTAEAEAIAASARTIELLRSTEGWSHSAVAGPLSAVGLALYDLGEYGTAVPFLRECHRIQGRALPPHHPDRAVTLNRIGRALHRMGERTEAEEVYLEALRVRPGAARGLSRGSSGGSCGDCPSTSNHPVFLSIMYNIAAVLSEQGRHVEAVRSLLLGKEMAEELVDRVTVTMVKARKAGSNFDDEVSAASTLAEAASMLHDAGTFLSTQYGRHADAYSCLALALRLRREVISALASLSDIADDGDELWGERPADAVDVDELSVARCLSDMGRVLRDASRYSDALSHFSEALRTEIAVLGPDHPDVASTVSALGQMHDLMGQPDDALTCFHRALRVLRSTGGLSSSSAERHDASISMLLHSIGMVYRRRGDEMRANVAFAEASNVGGYHYQETFGTGERDRRSRGGCSKSMEMVLKQLPPPAAGAA